MGNVRRENFCELVENKMKTFANWWKTFCKLVENVEKTLVDCLLVLPKDATPPNFVKKKKKNFRKWPQNLKNLRKFFFLKSTPLYGTFPKIWTNGIINATHGCRNLSVEFIWLSHAWLSHACDIAETQRHMTLQTVGQWVSCYCVVMRVIRKRLNRTLVAY